MARLDLRKRFKQGVIILDGAMGTQLIARGVRIGVCNDYINIESPNIVLAVHKAYIDAGSDAVLTNTFGANRFCLARHGLENRVYEINKAGAEIARKAAGESKYVLGDIGSTGEFMEPLGTLKADELKAVFIEQAKALLAGGVDGFIIETMTALDEIEVAVEAVKSVCGNLPVLASMSFDISGDDFRTMMGVDVAAAAAKMISLGVEGAGYNCGRMSLDDYVRLAQRFAAEAKGHDLFVFAEPNAGQPELVEDKLVYKVGPDEFADAGKRIYSAGVNVIGGCCGTTPSHIQALAEMLKS